MSAFMSDPAVLFVKPGAIKVSDKTHLRKAGVIVVEVANPEDVRFLRAEGMLGAQELPVGDLLAAAAKAINFNGMSEYSKKVFGQAVAEALTLRHGPGAARK